MATGAHANRITNAMNLLSVLGDKEWIESIRVACTSWTGTGLTEEIPSDLSLVRPPFSCDPLFTER